VPRRYQNQEEAEQEVLEIIGKMPHRRAGDGDFVLLFSDPSKDVKEAKGCSLSYARQLTAKLREQGLLKYVPNGGQKRADGRKDHAWLFHLPEQPEGAMEDATDIAEFNADMLRIAGAVQELDDRNLELIHRVQELESVEAENLRLHSELATATSTISALTADKTRLEGLLTEAQQQLGECMRNVGRLQIPETLRKLIKDKKN
jgi:hypothetical protein